MAEGKGEKRRRRLGKSAKRTRRFWDVTRLGIWKDINKRLALRVGWLDRGRMFGV